MTKKQIHAASDLLHSLPQLDNFEIAKENILKVKLEGPLERVSLIQFETGTLTLMRDMIKYSDDKSGSCYLLTQRGEGLRGIFITY